MNLPGGFLIYDQAVGLAAFGSDAPLPFGDWFADSCSSYLAQLANQSPPVSPASWPFQANLDRPRFSCIAILAFFRFVHIPSLGITLITVAIADDRVRWSVFHNDSLGACSSTISVLQQLERACIGVFFRDLFEKVNYMTFFRLDPMLLQIADP